MPGAVRGKREESDGLGSWWMAVPLTEIKNMVKGEVCGGGEVGKSDEFWMC